MHQDSLLACGCCNGRSELVLDARCLGATNTVATRAANACKVDAAASAKPAGKG